MFLLRRSTKLVALLCFLTLVFILIIYKTATSSGIPHTQEYNKILPKLSTDEGDQTMADRNSGVLNQLSSMLFSLRDKAGTMILGEKKDDDFSLQPYRMDVEEFLRRELGKNWTVGGNFSCRLTSISTVKFPICLYGVGEDKYVSGAFLSNRYWEKDYVLRIIRFFQRISLVHNNTVGFIDIGANIGAFTLAVAHMGYPVLAVEPNRATITRLASSVYIGNLTHKVKLLKLGVSDVRETFQLGVDITNRGRTYLSNCSLNSSVKTIQQSDDDVSKHMSLPVPRCMDDSISTVLMDDLTEEVPHRIMIMKIDIQCSELKALNPKTSSLFFKVNYVPLILMEWECYTLVSSNFTESKKRQIQDLMSFFTDSNYSAHSVTSGKRMSLEEWHMYTGLEVVLIKNDIGGNISWTW